MSEATIDVAGPDEMPLIVDMFNQIFRPQRKLESFERRFQGRINVLRLIARINEKPVGFFLGFELKPDTFFGWFYGTHPDARRMGIGAQLMEAAQEWAKQQGYENFRLECYNQHRPMLHLAINLGYSVTGIRYDADRSDNLVIFEKVLKD